MNNWIVQWITSNWWLMKWIKLVIGVAVSHWMKWNVSRWDMDYSNLCRVGLFIWFILSEYYIHANIYTEEAHADTESLYCTYIVQYTQTLLHLWKSNEHLQQNRARKKICLLFLFINSSKDHIFLFHWLLLRNSFRLRSHSN